MILDRLGGRRTGIVLVGLALLTILVFGILYFLRRRMYVSTDNAFIEANVVAIRPRVASAVARLYVDDNVTVHEGDVLLALDPRDFEARLSQARADLEAARKEYAAALINERLVAATTTADLQQAEAGLRLSEQQLAGARHVYEEAQAQTTAARAELVRAATEAEHYESLVGHGAVSRQETSDAVATYRKAVAALDAAQQAERAAAAAIRQQGAQVAESQARLEAARTAPDEVAYSRAQAEQAAAHVAQMEAAVRQAELDLSYTTIRAPVSGRVTRRSIARGDFAQVGQTLLSIVPDSVYVVANFKETQLHRLRPGQPATIRVDAYPDTTFTGRVQSIQAGSGAAFSLLPPENATGNYVKVVQRVPVKIVIDGLMDSKRVLGPGMSVEPRVRVR